MFGSDLTSDLSLKEAVVKKILLNPSFHSNGHVVQRSSLKLAEYFKKTDASSLKEIFVQLLEVFQDQSRFILTVKINVNDKHLFFDFRFCEFTSIQHQLGVAVCIIDFANMLRLVDHGKSEKFSYKYTKYFRLSNEYLDLANCVLQFAVGMLPEFLKLVGKFPIKYFFAIMLDF
jgi:hypothetical protein